VRRVLGGLQQEFALAMALAGARTTAEVTDDLIAGS
jgi:isopentenyl diphosphate isomerase/L-lactate dehydrogenase-like FMN-dependent dehydrogenase